MNVRKMRRDIMLMFALPVVVVVAAAACRLLNSNCQF